MHKRECPRCHIKKDDDDFPRRTGYCRLCCREYNHVWKSNHKKSPPKGELKGNWRRAEKDFDLPPITMVYTIPEGGVLCGFDKTEMYYIGTRSTAEDREDQFFCARCRETIFIPHSIYPRLCIWADSPEPVLSGIS